MAPSVKPKWADLSVSATPKCCSLLSVDVIRNRTESNLREKGLSHVTGYSPFLKGV